MNRSLARSLFGIFTVFALSLLLVSCEKQVNISLGSEASRPVVQGAIENGIPPYVVLTSTISFFENIDLNTLQNSFLHGANIVVSDGSQSVTLREYTFDTGASAKFYVYTVDTANIGNIMVGQVGKTYSLTITYEGKTYTSVTKIPLVKAPDTVWFDRPQFLRDNTPDSAMQLYANYKDPDTMGNYVRYFTQRGNQRFIPSGVFTDEVINGQLVSNIAMFGGNDGSNTNTSRDSIIYFFPGEEVTLKWAGIDKATYEFWNTLNFAQNSVGNPFASPINVKTNITNGAIGIWAGYGSVNITKVVPR